MRTSQARTRRPAKKVTIFERIATSRPAIVAIIIVVAIGAFAAFDMGLNWEKAYGNVSVNGIAVGGKNHDEITSLLKGEYGQRVSQAKVTIYADEEARERGSSDLSEEERRAIAEQISTEEAVATIGSWSTDAQSLKARLPYDEAADKALAIGRGDGGIAARLSLLVSPADVPLSVQFDEGALEELAADIDRTVGDPRIDATVAIDGGEAHAVEGHDGTMVDRAWLGGEISNALMAPEGPGPIVAQAQQAASRITLAQAEECADAVNRAISDGALFVYKQRTWLAQPALLGDWTDVAVVEDGDGWKLGLSIDSSRAVPSVVKGAGAAITSDDMMVSFEKAGDDIMVRTAGTGNIPEVAPAVERLEELLYGEGGTAWGPGDTGAVEIEIAESDRPETMTFDEALELGVITAVGEYTTEFSNQEGTENRNHNIKLAADILTNAVIDSDGGEWDFNDRSGDTNEEAGFWSAGSIVDGEYVDSIGGGICQVATTIFNAVYEAGLDVIERHNHTLYIASYPTGRDAAVSYPELDFIWRNDLRSDILMTLNYTDTSLTCKLFSVYTGYSATTDTGQWEEGKKYKTRFEEDDSLANGYYYLKTVGSDGSQITIERTVLDANGKTLKKDSFASVYEPKDEVYVIGPDVDTSKLVHKETGDDSNDSSDGGWY